MFKIQRHELDNDEGKKTLSKIYTTYNLPKEGLDMKEFLGERIERLKSYMGRLKEGYRELNKGCEGTIYFLDRSCYSRKQLEKINGILESEEFDDDVLDTLADIWGVLRGLELTLKKNKNGG